MKNKILTVCLVLFIHGCVNAQTCTITDFGARADSTILNTKAIQLAIDKCNSKGGGEVIVPAGKFYTGTVLLKSNVYLHLMPGAILQGSYDPADYPEHNILAAKKFGTIVHNGLYVDYLKALIIADSAQNTGIRGDGMVKGAGEGQAFQLGENKNGKPINILFIRCTNISLKGISVFNSAQVAISISGCEKVWADGIYINTLVNWNTDGMDVDAKDAVVSNCIIDSEDDALCFKSEYLGKWCENIAVTNCVVASNCNGIKIGTGSRTGFRNINVSNCVIKRPSADNLRKWNVKPGIYKEGIITSVNTGIVILGVDGGTVENINFSDITMTDVITPFTIRVGKRFLNPEGRPSVMRHICIQNIMADALSIIPSIVAGVSDSPVEDVKFTNVRISIPISVGADSLKLFPSVIPEMEKSYPENRMFGLKLPGSGFYVRHVKGIYFNEVSFTYKTPDTRPAFYFDEVKGIRFRAVIVDGKKIANKPAVVFQKNSQAAEIID